MASNGPSALVRAIEAALLDAAAVVVAWAAMVLLESLAVALLWDRAFSGSWEVSQARKLVAPIAIAGLAPASVTVVGWWRVALRAGEGARLAKVALAALGAIPRAALSRSACRPAVTSRRGPCALPGSPCSRSQGGPGSSSSRRG